MNNGVSFYLIIILLGLTNNINGQDRPNILWLTSEDNNINWVGCYGNPFAETPNIDQLAQEGFRYTNCYANAPVCAPSRSTWITGINAISMGTHPMRSRNNIPHNIISYYPDLLKGNGYYVANSAKTDYNIGGRDDKSCWDNKCASNPSWETLKQNQPFLQVINFGQSHESRAHGSLDDIKHDPSETHLYAYHPDLPVIRENYAKYYDAMKNMDAKVGEAIRKLEEMGLAENTIVIYNSDHGGVMARSKRFLFASGIHSPFIIRIPKKFRHLWPEKNVGTAVDRMVSFVDMPKTWLSITETDVPEYYQGNIFLGPQSEKEPKYHFAFRGRMDERCDNARAVYTKDFLYIRNYMPYAPWMQHLEYLWKAKATEAWSDYVKTGKANEIQSQYFYPKKYTEEFYDLRNDPDNVYNLIADKRYNNQIKKMRNALRTWQIEIHDSGLLPESELVRRASGNNITIYEMVRDPELYNLPELLNAADLALEQQLENKDNLRKLLKSNDSGLRYWGMVGCFLLNDTKAAQLAINDNSDEVKALAAWTLIKNNEKETGLKCLNKMINANSYAMLKILNIVDWLGKDGKALIPAIKEKHFDDKYYQRIQNLLTNQTR